MKTENIIFWAAGAGAIILVIYILVKKAKDKAAKEKAAAQAAANANQATTPGSTPSGSGSGSTYTLDRNKILSNGSIGEEVKELQRKLNALGATLVVDGQFGNLTETALAQQTAGGYREISLNQFNVLFPQTASEGTTTTTTTTTGGTGTTPQEAGLSAWWNPLSWFGVYGF